MLLVVVGVVVDVPLKYTANTVGWAWPVNYIVAIFVSFWLVPNELLSILETIGGTGVHIPPFIKPIIEKIKGKVESEASIDKK